jgi:hypothetical protein
MPEGHQSRSETDWAQGMQRLSRGETEADIVTWLAAKRSKENDPAGSKPDRVKYARRTVYKAVQRRKEVIDTPAIER